jgi:hypothetical protein
MNGWTMNPVRILNCSLSDNGGNGFFLESAFACFPWSLRGAFVLWDWLDACFVACAVGDGGGTNLIADNSLLRNVMGGGSIYIQSSGPVMRNLVAENKAYGLTFPSSTSAPFVDNVIRDNLGPGVIGYGLQRFWRNLVKGNRGFAMLASSNSDVQNNSFVGTLADSFAVQIQAPYQYTVFSRNIIAFTRFTGPCKGAGLSLDNAQPSANLAQVALCLCLCRCQLSSSHCLPRRSLATCSTTRSPTRRSPPTSARVARSNWWTIGEE